MALNSFDVIEGSAIICKECAKKPSFMAPNIGASSSAPNPVDYSQLDVSSIFENLTGEDFLTDALMSDDLDNQENVAIEVNRNVYQPPHPELTFLFEKVLTRTDCNPGPNRFLLPKHLAEAFLPMPPDEQKMPLAVKDTQGRTWNFVMRWWPHKNGRKYVLDGVRSCIQTMKWETGNTLKFYRQFPSGEHVIVLERNPDAA
ncbi:hypothetical protein RND81_09G027300 [Saponaria officinalis]|uniref:TF-B3 domain-containing protein n=1 Tax=Saponaria officinalis TaxID=3572 RepID=A0AAW1II10_SAPOF